MKLGIVDYRKGNLRSVQRAFETIGVDAFVSDEAARLKHADAIVLPGVGAFADASESLISLGLMEPVRESVEEGKPFLGICLGLHLMFEDGDEGAQVLDDGSIGCRPRGLGLLAGTVGAMADHDGSGRVYKIPHVGWNTLEASDAKGEAKLSDDPLFAGLDDETYVYFTHSYCAPSTDADIAHTRHARPFASAVRRGTCAYGVQFHPEKSSDVGLNILRNFISIAEES